MLTSAMHVGKKNRMRISPKKIYMDGKWTHEEFNIIMSLGNENLYTPFRMAKSNILTPLNASEDTKQEELSLIARKTSWQFLTK